MAVDVLNYGQVSGIAKRVFLPESERAIGAFLGGTEESMRLGDGFEIDGMHDYQPGQDDSRHIDWAKSASRSDGGLWVRDHYDERAPLTVLISDIPKDGLATAYAEGDQLSARALGFIASHLLLQAAVRGHSPIFTAWSGATNREITNNGRVFEGSRAPRKAVEAGLRVAQSATELAEAHKAALEERSGIMRRRKKVEPLPTESLASVIDTAFFRAQRISSLARFIVVSDFRDRPEDTFEALRKLRGSDVITIEVTNPNLRELSSKDVLVTAGAGKGVLIENDNQREEYKRKAAIRQAMITEGLHARSTHTASVDTSDINSLRSLTRLDKKISTSNL